MPGAPARSVGLCTTLVCFVATIFVSLFPFPVCAVTLVTFCVGTFASTADATPALLTCFRFVDAFFFLFLFFFFRFLACFFLVLFFFLCLRFVPFAVEVTGVVLVASAAPTGGTPATACVVAVPGPALPVVGAAGTGGVVAPFGCVPSTLLGVAGEGVGEATDVALGSVADVEGWTLGALGGTARSFSFVATIKVSPTGDTDKSHCGWRATWSKNATPNMAESSEAGGTTVGSAKKARIPPARGERNTQKNTTQTHIRTPCQHPTDAYSTRQTGGMRRNVFVFRTRSDNVQQLPSPFKQLHVNTVNKQEVNARAMQAGRDGSCNGRGPLRGVEVF